MKVATVFTMLVTLLVKSALTECIDENCTDDPFSFFQTAGSIDLLPFLGSVNIISDQNRFDDAIDPRTTSTEFADPKEEDIGLHIYSKTVISVGDKGDNAEDFMGDILLSKLQGFLKQSSFIEFHGFLNLSGQSLTGEQLANELRNQQMMGRPVTTLILSNSKVQGMTTSTFQPVEESLQELIMDNCTVNLDALVNFSNLYLLNLSNTGLSTFQWYPKLANSLKKLDLSHNLFNEVRPELSALTSLKELDLSYNRIWSVEKYPLALLPNLEVLSLTMNSLFNATFTDIFSLKRLNIDWNYLWRNGYELQMPSHSVQVKLASNPWRCDCGILELRDNHYVMDLDKLQCATRQSYSEVEGYDRQFLPMIDGQQVSDLSAESVEYLGCSGLGEQLASLRAEVLAMSPESQLGLALLLTGCVLLLVVATATYCQTCSKTKERSPRSWFKQEVPYLTIDKLTKPQEIHYIKI